MHALPAPTSEQRPLTELVWDEGQACTLLTDEAPAIRVAGAPGWSPLALLAAAVDAALLTRVLETAAEADLRVLGYVSATALVPLGGHDILVLRPTLLVASWTDLVPAHACLASAFATTAEVKWLAGHVRLRGTVQALVDGRSGEA
ncbi:MAG: hypothetical protein AB7H88_06675 [Vicinamibacterales bacterium]